MRKFLLRTMMVVVVLSMLVSAVSFSTTPLTAAAADAPETAPVAGLDGNYSHRLIVQLKSPSLAEAAKTDARLRTAEGKLNLESAAASAYISQLRNEQAAFTSAMSAALPEAKISNYINELGAPVQLSYTLVFNGLVVDPGSMSFKDASAALSKIAGVKGVYRDYARDPEMFASLDIINAQAAWDNAAIGGMDNAGAGVFVASMDGGIHKDAAMFSGDGFSYPAGFPAGGKGLTANNNGKIIVSRAYFREWDPPMPGDHNPWPGLYGTSHGVHTSGTMAGNEVVADFYGITTTLSGVAPKAWVGSYRVFYMSVNEIESFYNAEGIAALEDIARDGADVVNNSWGGGPTSAGGEFDALDLALINTAASGVFVSMSNGNAGPNLGTGDHPSPDYINVAASTKDAEYAAGELNMTAPEPVSDTLKGMAFSIGGFGGSFAPGSVNVFEILPSAVISASGSVGGNLTGCAPWPAGTFTGKAALISRGGCEFGVKVLEAEKAGAEFAIIYNNAGNGLINMGPGLVGDQVTIPSIFVGQTAGTNMLAWYNIHGDDSRLTMDLTAFLIATRPDVIADFSSRGPGVGLTLKPDITAPGVNVMSQGYADGVTGEARHLGYGQVSGTSMASPHIAGSAALLRQIHPTWSNDYIKSALMSTSKFVGVYNSNGTHAQPLDMGAGRVDLTNAADPGLIFMAPSIGFGQVVSGTTVSQVIHVTSVAASEQTYDIGAWAVSATGFATPTLSALPGFSVEPASITVPAGGHAMFTVTLSAAGMPLGDKQGFIVLESADYDAHLPAWGRVIGNSGAEVLLLDADMSGVITARNTAPYYTAALDELGITYDVRTVGFNAPRLLPTAAELAQYDTVILFTGDLWQWNGYYTVATPLTGVDQQILVEYANQGGKLIAMGQDLSSVVWGTATSAPRFYWYVLGAEWISDDVDGIGAPARGQYVRSSIFAPEAMQYMYYDLSAPRWNTIPLTGFNETTPVATTVNGNGMFRFNDVTNTLFYDITIKSPETMTITMAHIHTGTVGVNGPVAFTLLPPPGTVISATKDVRVTGNFVLNTAQETALKNGGYYVNFHSNNHPSGEVRGQVSAYIHGDGAGNQAYIDELWANDIAFNTPILEMQGGAWQDAAGVVALASRQQPSLEVPGITAFGRSVFAGFGLEGVNNGFADAYTRADMLASFMDWLHEEPVASIDGFYHAENSEMNIFEAGFDSNLPYSEPVVYRWDFGDGSPYVESEGPLASHSYAACGTYMVRVEITSSYGNIAIGELNANIQHCASDTFTFTYHDVEGILDEDDELFLKGGFNGWDNSAKMTRDGNMFSVTVNLKGGMMYEYKYFAKLDGADYWGLNDSPNRKITADLAMTSVHDYRNGKSWWANMTIPEDFELVAGRKSEAITLELWVADVTNFPGAGAGLEVMLGYGTDPNNMASWTWIPMTYTGEAGNNDLYSANITAIAPLNTTVYFVTAFNINTGDGNPNSMMYYVDTDAGDFDPAKVGMVVIEKLPLWMPIIRR